MGRITLSVFLLFFSISKALAFSSSHASPTEDQILGPEAFSFCGGWVEIWVQKSQSGFSRSIDLKLKASAPNNVKWVITNAHILVEDPINKDTPVRFSNFIDWNSFLDGSKTNIITASLPYGFYDVTEKLKVALMPFEGCIANEKTKGVVLSNQKWPVF